MPYGRRVIGRRIDTGRAYLPVHKFSPAHVETRCTRPGFRVGIRVPVATTRAAGAADTTEDAGRARREAQKERATDKERRIMEEDARRRRRRTPLVSRDLGSRQLA